MKTISHIFFVSLTALHFVVAEDEQLSDFDGCFRKRTNARTVCAQYVKGLNHISVQDCRRECLKRSEEECLSFDYLRHMQRCILYSVAADSTAEERLRQRGISDDADAVLEFSRCQKTGIYIQNDRNSDMYTSRGYCQRPNSAPISSTIAPLASTCPTGTTEVYIRLQNVSIASASSLKEFDAGSRDDCLNLCTQNSENVECKSVEYDGHTCRLNNDLVYPQGKGSPKESNGTDYFEKACLNSLISNGPCGNQPVTRQMQMLIIGMAETVSSEKTFNDCVENCLMSANTGKQCVSGMYFYNAPTMNCILNIVKQSDVPHLFTLSTDDLVDYFELDCKQDERVKKPLNIESTIDDENVQQETIVDKEDTDIPSILSTKKPLLVSEPEAFDASCNMEMMCCAQKSLDGSKDCVNGWRITKNKSFLLCSPPDDC